MHDTTHTAAQPAQLVEHFFRHETGRLHGSLIRVLGMQRFHLVEELAQEAMMRALRVWSMGGIPPNPAAWITRVAINLARDALRHERMAVGKEPAIVTHHEQLAPTPAVAWERAHELRDDMLRLLFACCHPAIAPDAQVVLSLKVICGFSPAEIAQAFLSSTAAIEKQIARTKQRIQKLGIGFEIPEGQDLAPRLAGVHGALYLLFNEGYKASSGDQLLREDLCNEAMRLARLLVVHPAGDTPRSHALLALMLLSAARFPSRLDEEGALLRLMDQDRSRWDPALIDEGLSHFAAAAQGTETSEYHLQAAIAAIHCTAPDDASTDWPRILTYYDALERLRPSPVVSLNRAVAMARVAGPQAGLQAIESMPQRERLESHYLLHAVTAELHWHLEERCAARAAAERAIALAQVGPEQAFLQRLLGQRLRESGRQAQA